MKDHEWDDDMDFIDDWVQVNWELLVERELLRKGKYLTSLSLPLPSRVTNKKAYTEYSVYAQVFNEIKDLKTGKNIPKNNLLRLSGFCSACKGGGFGLYPPFDLANVVLDSTKEIYVVPLSKLKFSLIKT